MAAAHLEQLNDRQREAVEHGVAMPDGAIGGPLLIIAGAGSGKTTTLAHRVAHLIVNGADPRRILLMTFSRRAASEMAGRVQRICKQVLGDHSTFMTDALAWAGTFHGMGARLLRIYAQQIGLSADFTIHDREDSADLMNLIRHELGFSKMESRFPTKGTCLAIYSRVVNSESTIGVVLKNAYPFALGWEEQLKQLFAAYVEAKQHQNVLDYDDLLLYWAQMMSDAALAEDVGDRFDHVLVDEYQDTNRLQASILLALKPSGHGLTVVGDDAQSIYSFRAATIHNILDFPKEFSPKPADVITLDRNYRSTQPILAAANGVISLARERFTKNLWTDRQSEQRPMLVTVRDESDQANYIVEQVLANREVGIRLKQQAVLFRTSSHSGALEVELTRRNIPFVKFGGLKFLDSAHVKDLLATLRFAQNPRDRVAGFRLCRCYPALARKRLAGFLTPLPWTRNLCSRLQKFRHRQELGTTGQLLLISSPAFEKPKAVGQEKSAWRASGTSPILNVFMKTTIHARRIWFSSNRSPTAIRTVNAFSPSLRLIQRMQRAIRLAYRFLMRTISSFPPFIPPKVWNGAPFTCSTSLTAVCPLIWGGNDGRAGRGTPPALCRHDTGPRQSCSHFFTYGQNAKGDRHVYASRTRFIPATLLHLFETANWPKVAATASEASARNVRIDVGARMRSMWK